MADLVGARVTDVVHVQIELGQFLALFHKVGNGHRSLLLQAAHHAELSPNKDVWNSSDLIFVGSTQAELQSSQQWSLRAPHSGST